MTYSEMESRYYSGSISEYEWRRFRFYWTWSAPRFGGIAGMKQDRAYKKLGPALFERRIQRVRRWLNL